MLKFVLKSVWNVWKVPVLLVCSHHSALRKSCLSGTFWMRVLSPDWAVDYCDFTCIWTWDTAVETTLLYMCDRSTSTLWISWYCSTARFCTHSSSHLPPDGHGPSLLSTFTLTLVSKCHTAGSRQRRPTENQAFSFSEALFMNCLFWLGSSCEMYFYWMFILLCHGLLLLQTVICASEKCVFFRGSWGKNRH